MDLYGFSLRLAELSEVRKMGILLYIPCQIYQYIFSYICGEAFNMRLNKSVKLRGSLNIGSICTRLAIVILL